MPDLYERLRGTINHRLELARAATPGPWANPEYDPGDDTPAGLSDAGWWIANGRVGVDEHAVALVLPYNPNAEADAAHIAANDPAQIIRDCESHLRILERHYSMTPNWHDLVIGPPWCWSCSHGGKADVAWPCDDINDLAHIYPDDLDPAAGQHRPAATT